MDKRTGILFFIFCCIPALLYAQADGTHTSLKDTFRISEIIIKAKTTVKISGDTVSYAVDSFYKNPLATTEDVLKRLPGLDVAPDGQVTMQGKKITRIYVNGREYKASDIRTLTQNIPAEVLEKIQVMDWYDDEARFTGVKPVTEQKAINLQLKKEYSQGLYGRGSAGKGNKDRYGAGLFANYMNDGLMLTSIGQINNIGVSNMASNRAEDASVNIPGVNIRKQANINFSIEKKNETRIEGLYEVTANKTELSTGMYRTTYLPGDTQLLQRQFSLRSNDNIQHRFSLSGKYKTGDRIFNTTTIDVNYSQQATGSSNIDSTYYNTATGLSFRRLSQTTSENTSPAYNFYHLLLARFNKARRSLSVNLTANYTPLSNTGQNDMVNQYFSPPSVNANSFSIDETRNDVRLKASVYYTEPLSERSTLTLKYTENRSYSKLKKAVYSSKNDIKVLDTLQSRDFDNTNIEHPVSLAYQYQSATLTVGSGIDALPYSRNSESATNAGNNISQQGVNYFPNIYARYNKGKQHTLYLNYNGSIIAPTIQQLQPIPDYTDSLNIFIGNPFLKPEVYHTIAFSYNYFNPATQKMFWIRPSVNFYGRKTINQVDVDATKRTSRPLNVNGVYNFSMSFEYSWPLLGKKLKMAVTGNSSIGQNITITNNTKQELVNYIYQPGLKFIFNATRWYEGQTYYTFRYNKLHSGSALQTNTLQTHMVNSDGTFHLFWGMNLNYSLNLVLNTGLDKHLDNNFFLLNAGVDKNFTKPKGLSLRFQSFDILNKYPNVKRVVGDNYYEDNITSRIGSYFLLTVMYRFDYFF